MRLFTNKSTHCALGLLLVRVVLLIMVVSVASQAFAAPRPVIPPGYEHWLQEVHYLISDQEQKLFLGLQTDQQRDAFIQNFWRIRNPDPNAPINAARQTLDERFVYANAHFGNGSSNNGWRSDRGMVYITLGPPQLIRKYPETRELRPLQIWFYQNLTGALPVHFYVLFYKQSPAEDYELYSPYQDRPQKLINSSNAVNDDRTAIKIIRDNIDDEAGHVALSLIPGEPVDFNNPTPSLDSDVLLNDIRNYRNLPQIRELTAERKSNDESVTHRIILGEQFSDLAAVVTRNAESATRLQYLFRLLRPADFSVAEQPGGGYYYALQLQTKLEDPHGKVLSDQTQSLSDSMTQTSVNAIKQKCFGVEGSLPIAPGTYTLSMVLTNQLTRQAFRQSRSIVVPRSGSPLSVSQVFFADTHPAPAPVGPAGPFDFSGVHLQPIGAENAAINQGALLRAIFQVWMAPGSPALLHGKSLDIHYLIGSLTQATRIEQDQKVDRGSFSPEGNLLIGRDFRTDTLSPGSYRLVIRVTDPASGAVVFQSLNFEVKAAESPIARLWTIEAPPIH
jgi:GWxTD domain-containing protein